MTPVHHLDHLVFAVPDLAAGVEDFARRTGVEPLPGGRHLGKGTRNFLVGLGPTAYLEIIGPDPGQPADPGVQVPFGVDLVVTPTLLTWSVHPPEPESAIAAAAVEGVDLGVLQPMSRRTVDGDLLSWRLASPLPLPLEGVVPFVIDWGSTPHPAASGLPQLDLVSLVATHPTPGLVERVFATMGLNVEVSAGTAGLRAVLGTRNGPIELL